MFAKRKSSFRFIRHVVCTESMLPIVKAYFCIDLKTGSKGEADKNCKSITPDQSINTENQSTGCTKRKRKANKKLFPDYDVSTTDEPEDSIAGKNFKF